MGYFAERTTKRITLPSNADYWLDVVDGFKWREVKLFVNSDDGQTVAFSATADKVLQAGIVDWNLDLADGSIAPVTAENIDKLEQDDVLFILNQMNLEADGTSKKNSSKQ